MENSMPIPPRIRPRPLIGKGWVLFGGLALAALLLLLYRVNPEQRSIFPPCLFHHFTGWSCPGCGATRAAHQLLHGEVVRAFQLNPMAVLAVPVVAYLALRHCVRERTGQVWPWPRWRAAWAWGLGMAIVIFSVARNLPWPVFEWFRI